MSNRCDFRCVLKVEDVRDRRRSTGRLFQACGPVVARARSPMVERRVAGARTSAVDAEHSRQPAGGLLLVGVSHFTWVSLKLASDSMRNANKSRVRNGEERRKVILNLYPGPDHHQKSISSSSLYAQTTPGFNFQWNELITYVVFLLTDGQKEQMTDFLSWLHNIRLSLVVIIISM